MRRRRRGKMDFFKISLLLLVAAAIYWAVAFIPHYWVAVKMDEVVTISILEWRDKHSMEKSKERLARELDNKEIPMYIAPEDCEWSLEEDRRHLDCWWAVDVKWPIVDKRTTLEFFVGKYLDKDDHLGDWTKG